MLVCALFFHDLGWGKKLLFPLCVGRKFLYALMASYYCFGTNGILQFIPKMYARGIWKAVVRAAVAKTDIQKPANGLEEIGTAQEMKHVITLMKLLHSMVKIKMHTKMRARPMHA